MSRITMEVRTASQEQIQIPRDVDVLAHERCVVIRVKRFHRVKAGFGQRREPTRQAELAWMRERRDPTSLVDHVDHPLRRRALTGNASGAPVAEPPVERLLRVCDLPSINHGLGNLRPPDRPTALEGGLSHQRLEIHRYTQRGKAGTDRLDARDTRPARHPKKHPKRLVQRIEQVTKHMEIPTLVYRSDLNAAYRAHTGFPRRRANLGNGRRRVVIGHGHHGHTGGGRARHQFSRGTPAI